MNIKGLANNKRQFVVVAKNKNNIFNLLLDGQPIERAERCEYLGAYITSDLNTDIEK